MNKQIRIGIIAAALAVIAIIAGTLSLDRAEAPTNQASLTGSKDTGMLTDTLSTLEGDEFDEAFLNDMIEHHAGAVEMAKLIDTEARSLRLQELALAIIEVQTKEIDQMKTWLTDWGYTLKEPRQSAINQMVSGLQNKSGAQLDIAFLSHMISHHQDALNMSTLANSNAKHQELKTLANQIYLAQESEIKLMKDIATEAGYTLHITEGHHSDGESHSEGDSHSETTVKH